MRGNRFSPLQNVEEEEGSGYDADDGPLAELKWQSFVIVYFIAVCICIIQHGGRSGGRGGKRETP